jgi:hypothetical protein
MFLHTNVNNFQTTTKSIEGFAQWQSHKSQQKLSHNSDVDRSLHNSIIRFHVIANSPQGFMLHFLHKHLAKVKKAMAIMWMAIFVK